MKKLFSIERKGLYVHIPFCKRKCRYCDFISFPHREDIFDRYLYALEMEMEKYKDENIDTVFIGGGTPTVLQVKQLKLLLKKIKENFNIKNDAEFSIEVNPGTLDDDKISVLADGGVNRVSIGVQSFNDNELKALGRIHDADTAVKTVINMYDKGLKNINIDLMTSIPYQTMQSLKYNIDTAMSLPINHISAYSLIVQDGTPIAKDYENGIYTYISDDDDRKMYDMLIKEFEKNGFMRYEISNFSKPGCESKHNIKYWECREYIGLGLAAHSYMDSVRYFNTSDIEKYISGTDIKEDEIKLTENDKISEFMMMGLRMKKGVSGDEFYKRFGIRMEELFKLQLEKFINLGLVREDAGSYALTDKGMDISNSVMCEFMLE